MKSLPFPVAPLSALVLLLSPLAALAGGAAFLPDGSQLVRRGEKALQLLELASGREQELALPESLAAEAAGVSLATAADGLLVAGGRQLFAWDPAQKAWSKRWEAPEGARIEDIACDPKSGRVILVIRPEEEGQGTVWQVLAPGAKEPGKVFNRRAAEAWKPVFDAEGNLYFACSGDLWKGSLNEGEFPDGPPFVLSGARIWPLAEHETSDGTSAGVGVHDILPLAKFVLCERSRMGGSGWGNIVRVPNADAYERHLPLKWDELADCPRGSGMALSRDGKSAAIYIEGEDPGWRKVDVATGALIEHRTSK